MRRDDPATPGDVAVNPFEYLSDPECPKLDAFPIGHRFLFLAVFLPVMAAFAVLTVVFVALDAAGVPLPRRWR